MMQNKNNNLISKKLRDKGYPIQLDTSKPGNKPKNIAENEFDRTFEKFINMFGLGGKNHGSN